ncbi:MAG: methylated-DNA--[protein]-cysteine S-methyltransferase [Syntrophorhabdaceae bacterium]|nr:methylated-DNA--[protein]-cysteine S-methyltransferase [Syntrophorhabdaceae bacterium]
MESVYYAIFESSFGYIALVSKDKRLIELNVTVEDPLRISKNIRTKYPESSESMDAFKEIHGLLERYFRGERVDFFRIETDLTGFNDFTKKVLERVKAIPYGALKSYKVIAEEVGSPNGARAVGQAVGINPVPIIIPCHRVIREDGTIGGYSQGIRMKERLLSIEGTLERIKRHGS